MSTQNQFGKKGWTPRDAVTFCQDKYKSPDSGL